MLSSGFLVVHDTSRGGEDDVTKLSGGQKVGNPLLDIANSNVKARRDDTSLVETTVELNNNLARSVIINVLKLVNVTLKQQLLANKIQTNQKVTKDVFERKKCQEKVNDKKGRRFLIRRVRSIFM